ncbi:MAG: T9SS type A sorting domain-containing protein [Chitinophagaceae bacterium]|nr:T9SS type A sorting domain-containing protein [Chitinophagaceae bacterium]
MKKITLIIFTFSGNYSGFAQEPVQIADSVCIKQNTEEKVLLKKDASMKLFPNPAKNKIEIEITGLDPGYVLVQLIDKSGNLFRNDKRLVYSGSEIITFMFSAEPGLYFIMLKQGKLNLKKSLIIQ